MSPPSKLNTLMRCLLAVLALALSACASARSPDPLADPAYAGVRFGLVVATMDGRELAAVNADERFIPASNTKLFTAAAVFHRLTGLDQPDVAGAASLWLSPALPGSPPDLILAGHGDATLGDGPDCASNCLAELADAFTAYGFVEVGDVIGDDTLFPDERWGAGWSWNNLETSSGTAISALTVNDNELSLAVTPGAKAGAPAIARWREGDALYDLLNEAATVETGETDLWIEHRPNSNSARLYGQIAQTAGERILALGVDDPALLAAMRLKRLLQQRGVSVAGEARALHRPVSMTDDPAKRGDAQPSPPPHPDGVEIARVLPAPLIDDVRVMLKDSQNLHAELMLRRVGLVAGGGSTLDGLAEVEAILQTAGAPRALWDLSDGSGMSTYNRVAPRATLALLLWAARQSWGEIFRDALPVGGVDGTLARRFRGTALEGKVFAKTGSLSGVNALAGYMIAGSGRMLAFAAYANDRPSGVDTAATAIDAALARIAAAH